MPFFAGLLPEGDLRRRIADNLHISETSTLRLLEALGGECAGAVRLIPEPADDKEPIALESNEYEEIALDELENMILHMEQVPLLISRQGTRLSLAGAQEKLPLLKRGAAWYRPLGNAPSSHILKPEPSRFPGIVMNEFICMRLAALLGIPVPAVELAFIGKPVLVIERYDRIRNADGSIARLHQQDFCQALGIMPDNKYQADGGPGFRDMAKMVRRVCTEPLHDIELLIDTAIMNFLIGNCDAHGKNYSLLHAGNRICLAPFYDLVATTLWPALETKLSMCFGREYKLERIGKASLEGFAADMGVQSALVSKHADLLIGAIHPAWKLISNLPELKSEGAMLERILAGCEVRSRQLMH
jgi:serine/threonine-protein kinase HipA